jgi:hypothetical protein
MMKPTGNITAPSSGEPLDGDGNREHRSQGQNRAGHESPDQGVAGGHEDFRLTRVDHLGDEFRRNQVGHFSILFVLAKQV